MNNIFNFTSDNISLRKLTLFTQPLIILQLQINALGNNIHKIYIVELTVFFYLFPNFQMNFYTLILPGIKLIKSFI